MPTFWIPSVDGLPAELLLNVLMHSEDEDILAIKLTSSRLRFFVMHDKASICNAVVTNYCDDLAALLQPILVEGWLIPQHPSVLTQELRVLHGMTTRVMRGTASFELLSEKPLVKHKPSVPGPTFLKFPQKKRSVRIWHNFTKRHYFRGERDRERDPILSFIRSFLYAENCRAAG